MYAPCVRASSIVLWRYKLLVSRCDRLGRALLPWHRCGGGNHGAAPHARRGRYRRLRRHCARRKWRRRRPLQGFSVAIPPRGGLPHADAHVHRRAALVCDAAACGGAPVVSPYDARHGRRSRCGAPRGPRRIDSGADSRLERRRPQAQAAHGAAQLSLHVDQARLEQGRGAPDQDGPDERDPFSRRCTRPSLAAILSDSTAHKLRVAPSSPVCRKRSPSSPSRA
jgi:hypothetical protein